MRVLSLVMAASISLLATTGFSSDNPLPNEKVKIYTTYGGAGMNIFSPVEISLVINGELVVAKNSQDPRNVNFSFIEVDKKHLNQEISQSQFTWIVQEIRYQCKANNLPLYVAEGDINTGTKINFMCK